MDYAHEQTDAIIAKIQGRVKKSYKQAAKEAEKKLRDYLNQFQKENNVMKDKVKRGLITPKEYKQWRLKQVAIGKRWHDMRDSLSQDMHNVNLIVDSVINGYIPDVYALNHNFSTFEIEKKSHMNLSYTLYDRQTVERLFRESPELLPIMSQKTESGKFLAENKDLQWNKKRIQSEIIQGILQGEEISKIAKRMEKVTDSNYYTAVRNARTIITAAQNAGRVESYKRAENMGIKIKQCWVATLDGRTRHSHRLLDGEEISVGGVFSNGCRYPGDPNGNPSEVYNCRCTLISQIDGFKTNIKNMALRRDDRLGGMTYNEWKKAKKGENEYG